MASPALRRAFQDARTEFKELSIGELKDYEAMFLKYDTGAVKFASISVFFLLNPSDFIALTSHQIM
jgi:hypothetical protein